MYIMPDSVEPMTWMEAERFCERYSPKGSCQNCYGKLVTIHDEAIEKTILAHLENHQRKG